MQQARHVKHQLALSVKHELLLLLILNIAKKEYIVLALARLQLYLNIMRSYRTPSMSYAACRHTCHYILRITELVVQTDESLSVSIESVHRSIHAVECIMVAALLVFGLMIYHRTVHLNLSGREITLEVLHVGSGIPQAPLRE